ncbi:MAG: N-acetylmuramoyl-L-alanine amidase [Phaeodactylibacter sp.]|nr:N-acetylmuramoyl-L-alanine amidase [Phaeodactylibacter sp.]MCB9048608.1 N-acetylmuramoyl-L-alanine amidase [Lewinellaceae bacterium]
MPHPGTHHHLLAELLTTLRAEGYPLGTGQQLRVQELLSRLPEDTTVEEMPFLLAPLFASNPKEQARFYELFEQCRRRTEAFYKEIEREERAEPDHQERRYRGLIWLLVLLLLIPPAIVIYRLTQPVGRPFIEKPFQVQAGGQAQACLEDSTDLKGFGTPESWEVVYPGLGNLGTFFVDTPQCLTYIAQDLIYGQDSVVLEWSNAEGRKLLVHYKPIVVLPEEPASDTSSTAELFEPELPAYNFEEKGYPFSHDPLAFMVQAPSPLRQFLAKNFYWLKWGGLLLFTTLLLAVLFYRAYRRRKLIAELEANNKPPYAWNIRIEGAEAVHLGDDFSFLLNLIRQRTGSEAFQLDVPRTIGATIEQGGMPTFRFFQQTQPPEYLLLIDQQSSRNHRARLLDMLFRVFHANEVLIERFFYDNDPRVCYNEAYPEGVPLAEIQQRYAGSRLIVAGYGIALLNKLTGKPEPWSRLFSAWKYRLLLTPRPTDSWGKRERRLEEIFTLLPLSMQSLLFWLQELEMEEDARFDTWPDRVKDAPRAPIELNGALAPSLQGHFSEPMLQWIAACAIYPALHWDLTLYLGQQLSIDGENLLTVENLLRLTRLSWFTEGRIPPSGRISLLSWMETEHPQLLERLRAQVADILQQNPPPSDSAAFEDYRMNVALNEWLTTKNKSRKKELEQELGRLMEAGAEADITVIKQLQRERHPLDFIVPDAWKKFLHPHGLPGLGWRGEWRDVLRWALPLWIPALLLTAWPWDIKLSECNGPLVEYRLDGKEFLLCLSDELGLAAMLEEHTKVAVAFDSLPGANAVNRNVLNWLEGQGATVELPLSEFNLKAGWSWQANQLKRWGEGRVEVSGEVFTLSGSGETAIPASWQAEYRSNMAVAYYNKGVELYQAGSLYFDLSPERRQAQFREGLDEWKKVKDGTSTLAPDAQQSMLRTFERLGLREASQLEEGQVTAETLLNSFEQVLAEGQAKVCAYFQEAIRLDSTQLDMYRIRQWCSGEVAPDTIPAKACYVVSNVPNEVALRSRVLTRAEADELNAAYGTPEWSKLRVNIETKIKPIALGEEVQLLEEGPDYYRVRSKGVEGYIIKTYKGSPVLLPCAESPKAVGEPAPLEKKKIPSVRVPGKSPRMVVKPLLVPVDPDNKLSGKASPDASNPDISQRAYTSRYLWCLDNPHGNDTPGKRSPVFDDGKTQLFEYELSRDVVDRIIRRLDEIGVPYYRIVPEAEDISLQERARRINNEKSQLPKLSVSVHFNAGPPQGKDPSTDWAHESLKGAEAWYYSASQDGRRLGAIFLEKVIRKTELRNRYLKSKEGSTEFYLLRNVNSPVTQVENGFYNNRADAALLAQPAFRQRLADAYVEAILAIDAYGLEKTPAPLIDERDSDADGVPNDGDLCPFTAGPADNKGCPVEEQKPEPQPPSQQQGKLDEFPRTGQVTGRDRAYRTVQFEAGGPTWMAENLDIEVKNSWCYDNSPKNCAQYGRLYTWETAQEACRQLGAGWRLPTDEEWGALRDRYGGKTKAYSALISLGNSRFYAVLGGYRNPDGSFENLGIGGSYWSGTQRSEQNGWYYNLSGYYSTVDRDYSLKSFGLSCRCIQD